MDTPLANEKQLQADIEQLREQFTQTQDLYREVCILLFFRYGMTPTANKLYQLVRKGSMSAPAEALNKFWEDLREKSRVRIEHPDLPEALKTAAGDLTAAIWASAQALANESLTVYRGECQVAVAEAKAFGEAAHFERDASVQAMEKALEDLKLARGNVDRLNREIAAATATNVALESQLSQLKNEIIKHQQQLAEARSDFTTELEKLRAAAQLADDRFRASETRALLEIDRERSVCTKLQKELEVTRIAATQSGDRMRTETATLQAQLGDTRQSAGVLEGKLHAAIAARDASAAELKTVQIQIADLGGQLSTARADAYNWRKSCEELQQSIVELKAGMIKVARPPRKAKTE
jgi:hypothetical protein